MFSFHRFVKHFLIINLDRDMAARHRARASSIQILKIETVESSKVRRPQVKQMIVSIISFLYDVQ